MNKKCLRCMLYWSETEFNWKIKGVKRATYCKECSREYIRKHYINNKEYYIEKAKKLNAKVREEVFSYLADFLYKHPCVDCGESDITVLEFDHRERVEKFEHIAMMIRRKFSLKKLIEEIAKCEVRCANCHRRKTAIEHNSWRLKYAPVA